VYTHTHIFIEQIKEEENYKTETYTPRLKKRRRRKRHIGRIVLYFRTNLRTSQCFGMWTDMSSRRW